MWLLCDLYVQRALSDVSDEEWLNIPDVGDARNKKQRNAHIRPDRYTPVPDSILQRATMQSGSHSTLDAKQQVGNKMVHAWPLFYVFTVGTSDQPADLRFSWQ